MSANDRSAIIAYALWACAVWSLVVAGSLYWNYRHEHEATLALARNEAIANINKDLTFRRWATGHGGVYVPTTPETPPNPYLVVPDREVVTDHGQKLTLMNPAYMVRQMQTLYNETFGVKGHITSLQPLNPGNAPDEWEAGALRLFERGEMKETATVADIDGRPHVRVIRAMVTEPGCLKCHAHQGYKIGDVRGGISASVPLEPYSERERRVVGVMAGSHGLIWLAGMMAIFMFYRRALVRHEERERAEREIRELNETLDRRVQQRTAELELANRELESFSYSVSHDLRAPLRAMNGFAQILLEDEAERLTPAGRDMLGRIRDNADRMGALIDDILRFSRVSRGEMHTDTVAMTELAREVVDELRGDYPTATVTVAPMPDATGDAAMLRQVWANLIGNALKFSSKRERPVVEVGAETQEGETIYFVRDNGAGFDMAHAEHLFGVFQRLHGINEFPGTGAGLAIVKRIVERHQGRVWAEAEADRGAIFRFTLGTGR